MYNLLKSAWI